MTEPRTRYFRSTIIGLALATFCQSTAVLAAEIYADGEFSLEAYGQVNPTNFSYDDGKSRHEKVVDNESSKTRVGIWAKSATEYGNLDFNFETGLGLRSSSALSQHYTPDWMHWEKTDVRKLEFIFSNSMGKLYAGQGSMASDGIASADFSNTRQVSTASIPDFGGAMYLRNSSGTLTDVKIASIFSDFDGPRRFRIRYDTPDMYGFTMSGSVGNNVLDDEDSREYYDISASYNTEYSGLKVKAKAGFWQTSDERKRVVASSSVLHIESGLSLTLAAGDANYSGQYVFAKSALNLDLFDVGGTSLSLDYYGGQNFRESGSESQSWGIALDQKIKPINGNGYIGYRIYDYQDNSGVSYKKSTSLMTGFLWEF